MSYSSVFIARYQLRPLPQQQLQLTETIVINNSVSTYQSVVLALTMIQSFPALVYRC